MKIELCSKELCTGCLACVTSCQKNAISVEQDFMGFSYPVLHPEACVSCHACETHCHILHPIRELPEEPMIYRYYGAESERMQSSSGAFLPHLIRSCYEKGYYIGGVVFSEDFRRARFVVTRSMDLIQKMRKSKYVDAEIGSVFSEIRTLIRNRERVLFVGLPCQVAALKKLVPDTDLLLCVDMLCHGNGSPNYYAESLASFCQKQGKEIGQIVHVDFRPKPETMGKHDFQIDFEEGSIRVPSEKFPYYYGFSNRLILRDSCYRCQYAGMKRVGDMTVGDSTFSDSELGESLVMLHTSNAKAMCEELMTDGVWIPLNEEQQETVKQRFGAKYVPKYRKKIAKIQAYRRLEKTYLCDTYVPFKYKIVRAIKKLIRR